MEEDLRRRLLDINQRFYQRSWRQFVARRQDPWPGWRRLLREVGPAALRPGARFLDLGCGHGRFRDFLADAGYQLDAVGVDNSLPLLLRATAGGESGCWLCADLLSSLRPSVRFDLVVAFGLLHHLPGSAERRQLVRRLAERVAAGGTLAITLWSPDTKRRRRATSVKGGEGGDVLLPWGEGEELRYCHFFDEAEVASLAGTVNEVVGATVVRFRADGRGRENHYLVARRPSSTAGRIHNPQPIPRPIVE